MSLIDDQSVVPGERSVAFELLQQDAIRHQLDPRARARAIVETHLVTDHAPLLTRATAALAWNGESGSKLGSDARRKRASRDAARLRVSNQASRAAPCFETELGKLRGFAGAGRAADDDYRMARQRLENLLSMRRDG